MYSTTCADINCADEFHILRYRVVRRVYTIFLRARLKKMCNSCAFVIQCYVSMYFIVVWNKGLLGLKKRQVDNGKFTSSVTKQAMHCESKVRSFIENLIVFFLILRAVINIPIPTIIIIFTMNHIMQDDHLKAGAWAACEETNNAHITTGIKDKNLYFVKWNCTLSCNNTT